MAAKDEGDLSKMRKQLKEKYLRLRAVEKKKDVDYKKRLIQLVVAHQCIWNQRCQAHADRLRVDAAWLKISATLGKPKEVVKKTWKAMKDHFRVIYVDITRGKRNASGQANIQERFDAVKWPLFKNMMFLKDNHLIGDVTESDAELSRPTTDGIDFDVRRNDTTISNDVDLDMELNDNPEQDDNSYGDGENNNSDINNTDYSHNLNTRKSPRAVAILRGKSKNQHHSSSNMGSTIRHRFENDPKLQQSLEAVDDELQSLPTPDAVTRFCDYLQDILREVPQDKQRSCFHSIINFANSCADNSNPVIVSTQSLINESALHQ